MRIFQKEVNKLQPGKREILVEERIPIHIEPPVVVEIGRDALGLPCYSTPEMLAIERNVVALAQRLANQPWRAVCRAKRRRSSISRHKAV